MFGEFILSTMISNSTIVESPKSYSMDRGMTISSTVNTINFFYLISQDLFVFTRGNMGKIYKTEVHEDGTITEYKSIEGNPLWKGMADAGQWELSFIIQCTLYAGTITYLNSIDDNQILSWIMTASLNLAELYCIKSWTDMYHLKFQFYSPIFIQTF